ncbi:MAG: hypothetical protein AAF533_28955 [Acidobacteriota bacterium]
MSQIIMPELFRTGLQVIGLGLAGLGAWFLVDEAFRESLVTSWGMVAGGGLLFVGACLLPDGPTLPSSGSGR